MSRARDEKDKKDLVLHHRPREEDEDCVDENGFLMRNCFLRTKSLYEMRAT